MGVGCVWCVVRWVLGVGVFVPCACGVGNTVVRGRRHVASTPARAGVHACCVDELGLAAGTRAKACAQTAQGAARPQQGGTCPPWAGGSHAGTTWGWPRVILTRRRQRDGAMRAHMGRRARVWPGGTLRPGAHGGPMQRAGPRQNNPPPRQGRFKRGVRRVCARPAARREAPVCYGRQPPRCVLDAS